MIAMKSENLGENPTVPAGTQLKTNRSKGQKAVHFKAKGKRHHQVQTWEKYLKQLRSGKKPKIRDCKQALNEVTLDSSQDAELRYYLGRAFLMSEQFSRAESTYRQALEICKKLNWTEGKSPIYSDLGYICTIQRKLNEAEELLLKAVEIDKQLGKTARMAIDYSRLAVVYRRRREFDKAEETARKSLRLAEKHGLEEEMARQYNNLGVIYLHQYKLDEAERMLCKGLDIDKNLKRSKGIAIKFTNLGWVYRARQNINKTREYWQDAKDLFHKLGMKDREYEMDRYLSDINE
jgi:tetratricopeptide (TPR) repeat protein